MDKHFVVIGEEAMRHKKAMDDAISERISAENSSRDSKVKLMKISKEYEEKIEHLSSKLSQSDSDRESAIKSLNEEFSRTTSKQAEEIGSLRSKVATLEEENRKLLFSESSLLRDIELEKSVALERADQIAALTKSLDSLKVHFEEKELEASIIEKKSAVLIKELREQLKKEIFTAKVIEANLKAANDVLSSFNYK
jgi:hypothetical protein